MSGYDYNYQGKDESIDEGEDDEKEIDESIDESDEYDSDSVQNVSLMQSGYSVPIRERDSLSITEIVEMKNRILELKKNILSLGIDYEVAKFKNKGKPDKFNLIMTKRGADVLALAFGLNVYPVLDRKTKESDVSGEIQHYKWEIEVRAESPNGQWKQSKGVYSSKEDFEPNESIIIEKAETRAAKRAILALTLGGLHWNHLTEEEKADHIEWYDKNNRLSKSKSESKNNLKKFTSGFSQD